MMKKYAWISAVFFVCLSWPSVSHLKEGNTDPYKVYAIRLKQTLELILLTLNPTTRKHYAVRLYRMTSDARYIEPVSFELPALFKKLRDDLSILDDSYYIRQRANEIVKRGFYLGVTNPNPMAWHAALVRGGDVAFYLKLAKRLNTLREYDLLDTKVIPGVNKMVEALREQKDRLITFLLNRELMKTAGAQLANYVNYLFRLNVVDIRQRYLEGLEEELMRGKPDTAISNAEYIEKIYGMTHVILAASDYYQEPVDRKEFAWIFDYFEKNIETILARTKPDVYAEVGLCFLAANERENPAFSKARDAIVAAIHPEKGMIVSAADGSDPNIAEHRNVLAIMLLDWPRKTFRGPSLRTMSQLQRRLPTQERE
jgi:uncharacterized protein DUF3541